MPSTNHRGAGATPVPVPVSAARANAADGTTYSAAPAARRSHRLDRISSLPNLAAARPARATATSVVFHPMRPGEVSAPAPPAAIAPATPGDPQARDRRAYARARAILDDLALLQTGLLSGEADSVVLRRLAGTAPGPTNDPRLAELVAHASLRAQVEIARRETRA